MGGRGASSGISNNGKTYGSEYHSVLAVGEIKFVKKNEGSASAPLETMTKKRVYVTVNAKDELKFISFYDENNKRYKTIDLDHYHMVQGTKAKPHIHLGYIHNENGDDLPTAEDSNLIDKVRNLWQNRHG